MWEELRCFAGHLFVCRFTALRPPALRPQLKRDPLGRATYVMPKLSFGLLAWSASVAIGYGAPAHAQTVITGFEGFRWGTTSSDILRRLGKPVEDLKEGNRERISYKQGPDSGYLFAFLPDNGLVAGIRILPLPSGAQCSAAVHAHKVAISRHYPRLMPVETATPDSTKGGCGGLRDWSILWHDREGNRILLTIDAAKGRLLIYYSNPLGS